MKEMRDLFFLMSDEAFKIMDLPVEQRMAALGKLLKEKKAEYLGYSHETAPEIATKMIKRGIKAQSGVYNEKLVDKAKRKK